LKFIQTQKAVKGESQYNIYPSFSAI